MAQNGDGIPYLSFSVQASGPIVLVSWQVKQGNTCQDVQVWRGTDSLHLSEVYTYPGICGDNDSTKVYRYEDVPPTPGIVYYYRIVVITDRTKVKSVLVPPEKSIEAYPVPATDFVSVVHNPGELLKSLRLYDRAGRLMDEIENPETLHRLELSAYRTGVYFLVSEFENETVVRKISVR